MATEKSINTVLLKLVNIFKDVYIINHKYCISGPESDKLQPGIPYAILHEEESSLVKDTLPDKLVYIEDVRKYKAEHSSDFIKTTFTDTKEQEIYAKWDKIHTFITKINGWEPLSLSEKQIDALLVKKSIVILEATEKYSFVITKQLLPMITDKTLSDVTYSVVTDKEERGGVFIVFNIKYPLFQFYNLVYYLTEDEWEDKYEMKTDTKD